METTDGIDRVFDRIRLLDGEVKEIHSFYYPVHYKQTASEKTPRRMFESGRVPVSKLTLCETASRASLGRKTPNDEF